LAAAGELAEGFEDGVWLVEVAPLADPSLVPQAVASTVGAREQPGRSLTETLSDHLPARKLLLVLDNCEYLIEACVTLVEVLLCSCPKLRVLATSREALEIVGERNGQQTRHLYRALYPGGGSANRSPTSPIKCC
jgi:predicted ATPase